MAIGFNFTSISSLVGSTYRLYDARLQASCGSVEVIVLATISARIMQIMYLYLLATALTVNCV